MSEKGVLALAVFMVGCVGLLALAKMQMQPQPLSRALNTVMPLEASSAEPPEFQRLSTAPDMAEGVLKRTIERGAGTATEAGAREGLGKLYESRGKLAQAMTEYTAASKAAGSSSPALLPQMELDRARIACKQGDFPSARAYATTALDKAGGSQERMRAESYLQIGMLDYLEGKYDTSREAIEKAKKAFSKSGDKDGVLRADVAECDRLQYARKLNQAYAKCTQVLNVMPTDSAERPNAERVLGMIHYFSSRPQYAKEAHLRAQKGYRDTGREAEALWVSEMLVDDASNLLEESTTPSEDPAQAELGTQLESLASNLRAAEEVIWWRVSDAELRLADLLRKLKRYDDAKRMRDQSFEAFAKRPDYKLLPDYATFFELDSTISKDRGDTVGARQALIECEKALSAVVGTENPDVRHLRDEISALATEVEV